jgi:DNA (cytosine-5)-methyltransferase 1
VSAYYNEIDPEKAQWIRELIKANVVTPGDVDERDIKLVQPDDLRGYRQCHFFAGIAVWSYALRLAGWADDTEVWTGSCPCPSFSSAGKGQGFDDARHLWPDWVRLIRECKPAVVFGEQADDAIGYGWLDLVQTDMEAQAYAVGKIVLGACSVGAPHIRQRLYFVADTERGRPQCEPEQRCDSVLRKMDDAAQSQQPISAHCASSLPLANTISNRRREERRANTEHDGSIAGSTLKAHGMANTEGGNTEQSRLERLTGDERNGNQSGRIRTDAAGSVAEASFIGGFWRDTEWLWCRDEKYRPVEPGTFPLAHGATNRVLKLRGYGDAINAEVAKAFIETYRESRS